MSPYHRQQQQTAAQYTHEDTRLSLFNLVNKKGFCLHKTWLCQNPDLNGIQKISLCSLATLSWLLYQYSFVIWYIVLLEASIRTRAPVSPQCLYSVFSALYGLMYSPCVPCLNSFCFVCVCVGGGSLCLCPTFRVSSTPPHRSSNGNKMAFM